MSNSNSESNSVCNNQSQFNIAIKKATDQYEKDNIKKIGPLITTMFIVWLIFLLWALSLAMFAQDKKIFHIVLSLVFSPIYVLSYYLSAIRN